MEDTADRENASRLLSSEMSDELQALGFEPGWPVMELHGCDFGIDLIHEALIRSTYWRPRSVPFVYRQRPHEQREQLWRLDMVPELVQAIYVPYQVDEADRAIGCHDHPKWYARGRLLRGTFEPSRYIDRIHVVLEPMEAQIGRTIDVCLVQLVRYVKPDADPRTPLVWLDRSKAPGQD